MLSRSGTTVVEALALAFILLIAGAGHSVAQDDEADELSDESADPIKLFDRGQAAHAKKEFDVALEFYDRALAIRPEFPEAEYQKAGALAALNRTVEAEKSYRRAAEILPKWPLPHATLGLLLARLDKRVPDAEVCLRRALELDVKNELGQKRLPVVVTLADLRARAGDTREALTLWQQATTLDDRDPSLWVARGSMERVVKDDSAALKSFARALELEPNNAEARLRRAEILFEAGQKDRALEDARAAELASGADTKVRTLLANLYGRMGLTADARRLLESLPDGNGASDELTNLRLALDARCEDSPESRATLEKIVESESRNASALACLGALYRTSEPARSLDFFRRASELEPRNVDYATGYAAALLQLKRLPEAATILERVLKVAPAHYAAHANFATTLYALRLYKRAIEEYKWIRNARPELGVVHFLIGSAHDHLGEYAEALVSYEAFLARADAKTNQLEIDKVKLRLPSLRRQIERGEGAKSGRKNR